MVSNAKMLRMNDREHSAVDGTYIHKFSIPCSGNMEEGSEGIYEQIMRCCEMLPLEITFLLHM